MPRRQKALIPDSKKEHLLQDNIRAARRNMGFSQCEAAERIGITQSCIASYEDHKNLPGMRVFIVMCNVYGVSPQDMLGRNIEVKL